MFLSAIRRVGLAALACAILITPSAAQEVRLISKEEGLNVLVDLISVDDDFFYVRVAASGDTMTIPREMVQCEGVACPAPERREADLVMVGSDNVGEDLMPLILEPYAAMLGGVLGEPIEISKTLMQYPIRSNSGSGGEILLVEVESTSSGPGLEALLARQADIAMSSRAANDEEVAALRRQGRGDLRDVSQEFIVAVDSVLMILHPSNPIQSLTRRQLRDIYSGRIKNWAQVGGPNLPVMVVARPDGSARANFENWAFDGPPVLSPDAVIIDGGKALTRQVMAEPGAVGYTISDNVLEAKPIDLVLDCGIVMDATTFKTKAEEYMMGRRIRLYTDNAPRSDEMQKLLDLMISPAADRLTAESGYIDLGIATDPQALGRLVQASLVGQSSNTIYRATRAMEDDLRGASRLSTTIRFETASSDIDNKARRDLDRLVEFLARPDFAGREIMFVGFADSRGDFTFNQRLSQQRAASVVQELRFHPNARLIRDRNIVAMGFGELAPMGCNDTREGQSRNRRVEVWVR